ncbi:(deoxy)nucleoside triphosphate pyrophosphohydrolase [Goodfellowiella coeruleoviolacea]|uniref:8-oxo-dGTP diphosphatase n=1 Tax=Goodfellowiella coeruleoviolacea TaxID=334858 RepID=A0AAE3KG70_9PSEU|nr:(deoxy)nucleoside triphosphate pyrophosphohydrolase [Goodfellowiella coeruleoviolacea]MCP2165637.1 8-oxo-dGTP diphosphatase [Goodfellowiella coeruleoviolacea]
MNAPAAGGKAPAAGVGATASGQRAGRAGRAGRWLAVPVTARVVAVTESGITWRLVAGLLPAGEARTALTPTGGGTLVRDTVDWTSPGGALGRVLDVVLVRRRVLRLLAARAVAVRCRAERLARGRVVVGAAIVRDGRLLAQQRAYPAEAAGRWELPGGRVEPGETDAKAVVRECAEELGVAVRVDQPLGPDLPLTADLLLRVYAATLADPDAEPTAVEHRALRWVDPAELAALDWLPADRALVPALRRLLTAAAP